MLNSELQKFDLFGLGRQVFRNDRDKMGLEDRLHFFMEDCDCFQVKYRDFTCQI